VDRENRLGEFLRARRELANPDGAGVPRVGPGRRRVPGLRREEVALLAGVSIDYYIRLEQGRDKHPSPQVLDALARVLALDDDATAYLHRLVRPVPRRRRGPGLSERVGPGLARLLASWSDNPAKVLGRRLDVLAANPLATALNPVFAPGNNLLRYFFLDPAAREFYPEWDAMVEMSVAALRAIGTEPDDPILTDLVGELSLKCEAFRLLWARHDVRGKNNGTKIIRHPLLGEVALDFESFAVNGAPGQMLVVYHAEVGSPGADALALLGSLAAPGGAGRGAAGSGPGARVGDGVDLA
jgi:transcriptional regulator with XRE-family HTH domain